MLQKVLCLAAVLALTEAENINLSRAGSRNTYALYTRANLRQPYLINTQQEFSDSPFNVSHQIIFIVHDHEGSGTTTINPYLKDEILRRFEANVIIVDWSTYANLGYDNAVAAVPSIAEDIAARIINIFSWSNNFELTNNIHLIGFGLGAHVCGITGRDFNGEIARITGLDPSGRLWGANSKRLSSADAKFVEVIHTDGNGISNYGIGIALGHVDFFINGGGNQPGCLNHRCCHNRAWEIMAASMGNRITGNRCNNALQNTLNLCRGVTLEVGNIIISKPGSGIYRANTRRSYPFV